MEATLFDNWSVNYEKDIIRFQNQYPFAGYFEIIEEIVISIRKNKFKSILDIGVGSGYMLNKILESEPLEYFGLDFSNKMLEIAKSKLAAENFDQFDITKGIPSIINARKFDCILSAFTLHHFETDEKLNIIDKYFEKLNDHGKFFLADISFESKNELNKTKLFEGKSWDLEEEKGYIIIEDFINDLEKKNYKVKHKKVSFCNSIFEIFI